MVRIEYEGQLSLREERQLVNTERLLVGAKCHGQRMKVAPVEDIPLSCDRVIGTAQSLAHEDALLHT
jgi:hypothetical protein